MRKYLFGGVADFVVAACVLGVFVACSDASSDGSVGEDPATSGSNAGGAPTSYGGTQARAGTDATTGSHESGGAYGGTHATAGSGTTQDGGAADLGGAANADESGGAAGAAPCVPEPPALPSDVPALIAAPDGVMLIRHFHAVGTQNYRCSAMAVDQGADPTFVWTFVGPKADMLNSCGTKVGTHFAAPNTDPPAPEWQYDVDGSSVVGAKVDASPVEGAIPELLLKQAGHGGTGVFAGVTYVQRLHTLGGAMPAAASCDLAHVDEEQDVGYTAEYYFYSGGT